MRFSLQTLLLLFPLLIAAYGLAYLLNGFASRHPYFDKKWTSEQQHLHSLQAVANDPGGVPWSASIQARFDKLHEALNPQTSSRMIHSSFQYMKLTDCWDQPYRCVCLGASNQVVDESQMVKIGVYSVGEDGLSRTNGNDLDDLNSWMFSDDYYQKHFEERVQWEIRRQTLSCMPISLGIFTLIWWFFKPFSASSLEWERSRSRHEV